MPVITLEYDNAVVDDKAVLDLSNAIQKIVSETTGIEDVFVYANTSHIKVKIAPIEIWVQVSRHKIPEVEKTLGELKDKLSAWKAETGFKYPINLTLTPEDWKFAIGI
jgi:hypothetical protein